MPTERQIAANRANASKSSGPKTTAGKQTSSRNGIHHGLLTQSILLKGESPRRFRALLASLREDFQPRTSVEASLVETMAVTRWRQMRLWSLERARLDHEASKPVPAPVNSDTSGHDGPTRFSLAMASLADGSHALALMNRYETCFDRQYSRALNNLLKLREKCDFSGRSQFSGDEKST